MRNQTWFWTMVKVVGFAWSGVWLWLFHEATLENPLLLAKNTVTCLVILLAICVAFVVFARLGVSGLAKMGVAALLTFLFMYTYFSVNNPGAMWKLLGYSALILLGLILVLCDEVGDWRREHRHVSKKGPTQTNGSPLHSS